MKCKDHGTVHAAGCPGCLTYMRTAQARRLTEEPRSHGINGYQCYGCRCDTCKAAQRIKLASDKAKRLKRPIPAGIHGKDSTYNNWDCRCSACVEAHSLYLAAYYQRRKRR